MKNNKLVKSMQAELDYGESLHNIFYKYKSEGIKEKKLAYFTSTLKDKVLIKKHKIINNILVAFMFIVTAIMVFLAYSVIIKHPPGTAKYFIYIVITIVIVMIPMLFLYGFIKNNYQAYSVYIFLAIIYFTKLVARFPSDNAIYEVELLISVFIFILVLYLKYKIFPYMGLFGAKKDVVGQYLVAKNN